MRPDLVLPPFLVAKLRESPCEIVLTGAGGWIGQAVLEILDGALGAAMASRVAAFGARERMLRLRSGREVLCRALEDIAALKGGPKLFVHCAFLTKDRLQDCSVEAFVDANAAISERVAAAVERAEARGLFMPSSGAVYKKGTRELDLDRAANPYGVMKLEDERRFGALAAAKAMPWCAPRLFNLAGPFINKPEVYVLASLIGAVQAGVPLRLRAAHRVVRSYVHVGDLVTLGFAAMLDPRAEAPAVFDTAGDEVLEVGELAVRVREILGRPDLAIERPALEAGRDDVYVGDGAAMARLAAGYGVERRGLGDQIRDTADYFTSVSGGKTRRSRPR